MDIDPIPLEQYQSPQLGPEALPIFVISGSRGSLGRRIACTKTSYLTRYDPIQTAGAFNQALRYSPSSKIGLKRSSLSLTPYSINAVSTSISLHLLEKTPSD